MPNRAAAVAWFNPLPPGAHMQHAVWSVRIGPHPFQPSSRAPAAWLLNRQLNL
jgi:hypothetical protein